MLSEVPVGGGLTAVAGLPMCTRVDLVHQLPIVRWANPTADGPCYGHSPRCPSSAPCFALSLDLPRRGEAATERKKEPNPIVMGRQVRRSRGVSLATVSVL